MNIKIIKSGMLAMLLAGCGLSPSTGTDKGSPTNRGSQTSDAGTGQDVPQPIKWPQDDPGSQIHPNYLYPVTLCGGVGATAKDPERSEYRLENGSTVVYLKTSDPEVLERLRLLNGIHPHSASGCVHGRYLPTNVDGRVVFEIEKESIAIASGGFSVSN